MLSLIKRVTLCYYVPESSSTANTKAILQDSELIHQVYTPRSYVPNVVLTKPIISLSVFKMTSFNITSPPKIYMHYLSPFPSTQPFKPA